MPSDDRPFGLTPRFVEKVSRLVTESRAFLMAWKSLKGGGSRDSSSEMLARFRRSVSSASSMMAAASLLLDGADLDGFAKSIGCEWVPSKGRLNLM